MMFARLLRKNIQRRPMRTLLTIGGITSAMLLWILVDSLSAGLDRALSGSESARTLIVYRQNRYCPQTSFLPEFYVDRIRKVAGVTSVLPVKVFLSNCRASLDVVAFQGSPVDTLLQSRKLDVVAGDVEQFRKEKDGALVGRGFAQRRRLDVGDQFRFGNIGVKVAGIFESSEPVEENLILTHLDYLQRSGPVNRLGTVTEFEVKVDDASNARRIATEIDDLFATADSPTDTRSKLLFLSDATRDLGEILRFGRLLGIACVIVVLVLVANTVVMSVQERVREFGVFRTVGYRGSFIVRLILAEALTLAVIGTALGAITAILIIRFASLSIGTEGVIVEFATTPALFARAALISAAAGLVAGFVPAFRAARVDVCAALRGA